MRNLVVGGMLALSLVACGNIKGLGDIKVKGADLDLVNDFYTQCISDTRKALVGVTDPVKKGEIAKRFLDECYDKFSGPILVRIQDAGK